MAILSYEALQRRFESKPDLRDFLDTAYYWRTRPEPNKRQVSGKMQIDQPNTAKAVAGAGNGSTPPTGTTTIVNQTTTIAASLPLNQVAIGDGLGNPLKSNKYVTVAEDWTLALDRGLFLGFDDEFKQGHIRGPQSGFQVILQATPYMTFGAGGLGDGFQGHGEHDGVAIWQNTTFGAAGDAAASVTIWGGLYEKQIAPELPIFARASDGLLYGRRLEETDSPWTRGASVAATTIMPGDPVAATGQDFGVLAMNTALAATPARSWMLGVSAEGGYPGEISGYVRRGPVEFDTQAFTGAAGSTLWLQPAGGLNTTKPSISNATRNVIAGTLLVKAELGKIYVDPVNFPFLHELSGVSAASPTDKQILSFSTASNRWETRTLTSADLSGGPWLPLAAGPSSPLAGTLHGTSLNFSGWTADAPIAVAMNHSNAFAHAITVVNFGLTAGQRLTVDFGQSAFTNNQANFGFAYAGAGSTANKITLGLYGNNDLVTIAGTGVMTVRDLGTGFVRATSGALSASALVAADIPALDASKITTGTFPDARIASSAAWNGKEPGIAAGTTAQYWRGDKSWQTLNTAAVPELTNLYYTDARARAALSATSPLSYNSSTGVISHLSGDGKLHVPATSTTNNGRFLQAGATAGSLAWIQVTPALIGAAPSHSVAANYVLKSDGSGGFAASNITDTGSQVSISGRFTAPAYAATSGTPPILFGQNFTSISDIACVGIGVPAANSSGLTRPLVIRRGNTPLFIVDDMGNTNVYGALVVSGLLQFSSLGAGFVKSNSSGIISVDGTVYATVSSLSNYLSKTAGGTVSGYTTFSSGLAATAGISVTGTAFINAGGQLMVSKDSTPTTSFNTLYSQAPIVVNRVTTSGTSTVAGIGFHNSNVNAALLYYDAATSVFKYNRETANGIVTIWDSSNFAPGNYLPVNNPAFTGVLSGPQISINGTGSATIGSGPYIATQTAGGSAGWVLQLGASNTWDLWNLISSTWTKQGYFLPGGNLVMNGAVTAGNAEMATWAPAAGYAWFGANNQNQSTSGNSGFLQQNSSGRIYMCAPSGTQAEIQVNGATILSASSTSVTLSKALYLNDNVGAYIVGGRNTAGDPYFYVTSTGTPTAGLRLMTNNAGTGIVALSAAADGAITLAGSLAWGGGGAIGSSANVVQGENSTRTFHTNAWTSALPSGFYQSDSAGTTPSGGWCHMIAGRHTDTGRNYQSQIATDFWNDRVWFRRIENGSVKSWRELWHSGNMTNDGPWLPLTGNKTVTGHVEFNAEIGIGNAYVGSGGGLGFFGKSGSWTGNPVTSAGLTVDGSTAWLRSPSVRIMGSSFFVADFSDSSISFNVSTSVASDFSATTVRVGTSKQVASTLYSTSGGVLPVLGVGEWCFVVHDSYPGMSNIWSTNSTQRVLWKNGGTQVDTPTSTSFGPSANGRAWILYGPTFAGSIRCSLLVM